MNNRFAQLQESASRARVDDTAPRRRVNPLKGSQPKGPKKKRNFILPIFLIVMGCGVFLFAAWSAVRSPALAFIINSAYSPQAQQPVSAPPFARVYIAKPTYTPAAGQSVVQMQPTPTFTSLPPAEAPTQVVVIPPTDIPTLEVAVLPENTDAQAEPTATLEQVAAVVDPNQPAEAVAQAEIVPDTPTPEYAAPTAVAYAPPRGGGGGEHWFDVDLSDQRMYAYEGDTVVRTFIVSTGTWQTPTVTGRFKVWIKLRSAPMSGPGYYLPDVPYIMYFYKGYGIHGTYWHNNFGVPMSHGCVNLSIPDAEWAYNFAVVGTVVNVHY
ncbi:MAG: L,D-transpeptidase family protein [Chloroflexi bacterium]|nr:L,D-transpeptidase family protein [Chloroflexota bacterium]